MLDTKTLAKQGDFGRVPLEEAGVAFEYIGRHAFKWAKDLAAAGGLGKLTALGGASSQKQDGQDPLQVIRNEVEALAAEYEAALCLNKVTDADVVLALAHAKTRGNEERALQAVGARAGASAVGGARHAQLAQANGDREVSASDTPSGKAVLSIKKKGRAPADPMRDPTVADARRAGTGVAAEEEQAEAQKPAYAPAAGTGVTAHIALPKLPHTRVIIVREVVTVDANGVSVPGNAGGAGCKGKAPNGGPYEHASNAGAAAEAESNQIGQNAVSSATAIARRPLMPTFCGTLPLSFSSSSAHGHTGTFTRPAQPDSLHQGLRGRVEQLQHGALGEASSKHKPTAHAILSVLLRAALPPMRDIPVRDEQQDERVQGWQWRGCLDTQCRLVSLPTPQDGVCSESCSEVDGQENVYLPCSKDIPSPDGSISGGGDQCSDASLYFLEAGLAALDDDACSCAAYYNGKCPFCVLNDQAMDEAHHSSAVYNEEGDLVHGGSTEPDGGGRTHENAAQDGDALLMAREGTGHVACDDEPLLDSDAESGSDEEHDDEDEQERAPPEVGEGASDQQPTAEQQARSTGTVDASPQEKTQASAQMPDGWLLGLQSAAATSLADRALLPPHVGDGYGYPPMWMAAHGHAGHAQAQGQGHYPGPIGGHGWGPMAYPGFMPMWPYHAQPYPMPYPVAPGVYQPGALPPAVPSPSSTTSASASTSTRSGWQGMAAGPRPGDRG